MEAAAAIFLTGGLSSCSPYILEREKESLTSMTKAHVLDEEGWAVTAQHTLVQGICR